MAVQQFAVNHDTRSHAGTEGDDDKVLHAACRTIDHLALCRSVGIVRNSTLDTHTLADEFSQRHYTLPRQVRRILDAARIEIAVRRTAADANDITERDSFVLYQTFQTGAEHITILVDIRVLLRRDGITAKNLSFFIN